MQMYKFTVEEIKNLVKHMVILVDSREKKNGHVLDYFGKQGIAYQKTKLDYGDYSFYIPAAETRCLYGFFENLGAPIRNKCAVY